MMRRVRPFLMVATWLFAALLSTSARPDTVSFATPPEVGDTLQPQPRLIHCRQPRAARFSSNTGFIGSGCRTLVERDTWSVIRCSRVKLPQGSMWLVKIRSHDDEVRFVPIPWHDWV